MKSSSLREWKPESGGQGGSRLAAGKVLRRNLCGRLSPGRRRCLPPRDLVAAAAALGAAAAAVAVVVVILALFDYPTSATAAAAADASTSTCFASAGGAAAAPPWSLRGGAGGWGRGGGAGAGAKGATAPPYARNPPRDPVLYDELEVHWGATARDIKKAYYRLAVQHHPDKKPGDSQAEDRFKRVSEAYHILQDETVREKYHRRGVSALEEDSWGGSGDGNTGGRSGGGRDGRGGTRQRVDPMEVFRTFLGGGMFEHLIGPLSPRMVPVRDPDYHHQKSKSLAEELERRLEVDVQGSSLWFEQAAWAEALQLREQSMGREILRTVGYVYKNYAQRSLGKLSSNVLQPEAIRGRMKFYSDQAHRVNNLLSAVSSTTRLYVHLQTRKPEQQDSEQGHGKRGRPAERYSADEEETVTRVLEALWSVHRVDVEQTVQRACKMVLRDPRMPPSVLKKRAEALMRLGRIFTSAAKGKTPPEPGTFQPVDSAAAAAAAAASSDPFAATGAFSTPSYFADSSMSPYVGYGGGVAGPGVAGGHAGSGGGGEAGSGGTAVPAAGWREEGEEKLGGLTREAAPTSSGDGGVKEGSAWVASSRSEGGGGVAGSCPWVGVGVGSPTPPAPSSAGAADLGTSLGAVGARVAVSGLGGEGLGSGPALDGRLLHGSENRGHNPGDLGSEEEGSFDAFSEERGGSRIPPPGRPFLPVYNGGAAAGGVGGISGTYGGSSSGGRSNRRQHHRGVPGEMGGEAGVGPGVGPEAVVGNKCVQGGSPASLGSPAVRSSETNWADEDWRDSIR